MEVRFRSLVRLLRSWLIVQFAPRQGYAHVFNTLQTESPSLFKKLRLLHSYASQDTAFELKRLNLESVRFEGLFEQRKLGTPTYSTIGNGTAPSPVLHRKSTPVSMVTSSNGGKKRSGYTSSNGNTSQPETFGSPVKPAQEKPVDRKPKLKAIDPTKVSRQNLVWLSINKLR